MYIMYIRLVCAIPVPASPLFVKRAFGRTPQGRASDKVLGGTGGVSHWKAKKSSGRADFGCNGAEGRLAFLSVAY